MLVVPQNDPPPSSGSLNPPASVPSHVRAGFLPPASVELVVGTCGHIGHQRLEEDLEDALQVSVLVSGPTTCRIVFVPGKDTQGDAERRRQTLPNVSIFLAPARFSLPTISVEMPRNWKRRGASWTHLKSGKRIRRQGMRCSKRKWPI